MKMSMGLESKEGALRTLGEEFPEEKLQEIREEMMEDAKADGALKLLQAELQKQIMDITGMMPTPDGGAMPMDPMVTGDVVGDGVPEGQAMMDPAKMIDVEGEAQIRNDLVTQAYGTKMPNRNGDVDSGDHPDQ